MSNLSGLTGKTIERKGGPRFKVHWQARLFMADRVIHPASVTSVFGSGFSLLFHCAVPIGTRINLEFTFPYRQQVHRPRVKVAVDYCLLRAGGDAADIDVLTQQISASDQHLLNNLLQQLSDTK